MPALPQHVALIMDGNGRWAARRGLPRIEGHRRGAGALLGLVSCAARDGVKTLTVFGFSTENWHRPPQEVEGLMALLRHYLKAEVTELHTNNVLLRVIGDRAALPPDIVTLIQDAEALTAGNAGLVLVVALNYGGRADILRACQRLAAAGGPWREDALAGHLYTAGLPPPDLLIRTAGERRLSNFLLWDLAYTELHFTDVLWPDFGEADWRAALADFARRERRFGGLGT
ncbi:MAG TPA: di-trans,poly-cis-decaprenylcistransferase [Rhodospirillaceae bacterium]|jgi:undecaprenyl diphosphate synthase|nr:di-trans,poly-cis-decaprenylcistransferase [Alphaproteobacteria bacterium]HBH27112.1 di-trans,poly-cis-decaprenylcistransferase [Rhodospirillaceae bacterium]